MRNELDINYYLSEIILVIRAKPRTAAVVVESKSDERFYKKFFTDETTFFSVDGFQKVIDVITKANIDKNIKYNNVLGIIDADFRHYLIYEPIDSNIFITDCHDVQMMTVNSEAWEHVVSFYSDNQKLIDFKNRQSKSLKDVILEIAFSIGCIRYVNQRDGLCLKFKTFSKNQYKFIDYSNFIDENNFCVDGNKLRITIENKSQKQGFFSNNPGLIEELNNIDIQKFDLLKFCNGHDVINILLIALRKIVGKEKDIDSQSLENELIIAYRYEDFKETELYHKLLEWQLCSKILVMREK